MDWFSRWLQLLLQEVVALSSDDEPDGEDQKVLAEELEQLVLGLKETHGIFRSELRAMVALYEESPWFKTSGTTHLHLRIPVYAQVFVFLWACKFLWL